MKSNYKCLKIQIPNGYEIDENESTFENIVFKKKDNKSRNWKEYCEMQKENKSSGYFIDNNSDILPVEWHGCNTANVRVWKNVLPNLEYAEAFLALMQLISLRKAWVGDWEPDFNDISTKWLIQYGGNKLVISVTSYCSSSLSFPTEEMAEDFLECFKDLLEQAKILL